MYKQRTIKKDEKGRLILDPTSSADQSKNGIVVSSTTGTSHNGAVNTPTNVKTTAEIDTPHPLAFKQVNVNEAKQELLKLNRLKHFSNVVNKFNSPGSRENIMKASAISKTQKKRSEKIVRMRERSHSFDTVERNAIDSGYRKTMIDINSVKITKVRSKSRDQATPTDISQATIDNTKMSPKHSDVMPNVTTNLEPKIVGILKDKVCS